MNWGEAEWTARDIADVEPRIVHPAEAVERLNRARRELTRLARRAAEVERSSLAVRMLEQERSK